MLVSYVISTLFLCASLYQQQTQEPHRNQEHGSLYHGLYVTGLKDGLQNYCAQAKIYRFYSKVTIYGHFSMCSLHFFWIQLMFI